MRIRSAKPSDARGIAEVHVAAWRSAYRELLPDATLEQLSVKDVELRWQGRLAEPWAEVLVLTRDEQVVGFVGYGPTRDDGADREKVGEIYVLYVAPPEWRKGHGTALLREAMDRCRAKGNTEAVLWVLHDNAQAIAFYETAGFVADGAQQVKERADGTRMTVARYRYRL
jgi:ribosomal protein S18 acetylase RimI-like enzyme